MTKCRKRPKRFDGEVLQEQHLSNPSQRGSRMKERVYRKLLMIGFQLGSAVSLLLAE
jgi:hypothetical protein